MRLEGFVDLVGDIFLGQNQVYFGFTASTGGANNVQTVCPSANILGSMEQGYICPGAEHNWNAEHGQHGDHRTPTDYLDDPTSASPICVPPRRAHRTPRLSVASYTDQCGVPVSTPSP